MKKILTFLFIIPSLFFAQEQEIGITGLTISQISTNEINVNLETICGTIFKYNDHTINLSNNVISIDVCYYLFGATAVDEDIQNFNVQIPNNGTYTLNIKCFTSNTSPVCNYFFLEDLATLNFNFPLTEPVSLSNYNFEKSMKRSFVFPNPASTTFQIQDQNLKEISLYDNFGRLVKEFLKPSITYDISELRSGIYYVQIKDVSGNLFKEKLVKK